MPISGAYGKILVGPENGPANTNIAEMSDWVLNLDVNDVDVTNFDSEGWVERLSTFKDWSGSCKGNLVIGDAGQMNLIQAYIAGEPVTLQFFIGKPTGSTLTITGKATMTLNMEASVDSQATFSADFKGMGALTITYT